MTQYAKDSPYLTFFIVTLLIELVCRCFKATVRALAIRKAGWPPEHCDADGNFKKEEDKEAE